jgi:hypothetical protein
MAQIHDLILQQGIDATRALAMTKAERVATDAAFKVMTDEEQRIGIIHAGFAMTALPHRATAETVWERQSGDVKLLLESGRTSATESVGLPYGSVARMILLYLQTEAVNPLKRCRAWPKHEHLAKLDGDGKRRPQLQSSSRTI